MSNINLQVDAITDKGNIKKINQDSLLVKTGQYKNSDFGLFIVCDGIGGLQLGEVASSECINIWDQWWENELETFLHKVTNDILTENKISNELERILIKCNNHIRELSKIKLVKMGTTSSILFIFKNKYYIAHVGDSRIYFYMQKEIELQTIDDTLVNLKIKRGEMTIDEAAKSKDKHVLTQCIGVNEKINVFTKYGDIENVNAILICSDGFYNRLHINDIKQFCKSYKRKGKNLSLQDYIQKIRDKGESDNISAIIIDIHSNYFLTKLLSKIKGEWKN